MILKGPSNISWKESSDGVKLSEPGLTSAGYDMRVLYVPKNKQFVLKKDTKTIVTLLKGRLRNPKLAEKESRIFQNKVIEPTDDSLLFLCYDLRDNGKMKDSLDGLDLEWIEVAKGCYRSDPKIEVDNYRINLWYLIPNRNGGIHNHAESTDHNISESIIEMHTQLRGSGWMVRYREQDENTEYGRFEMKIGNSHPILCKIKDNKVNYPWHAYVTGPQGALFLAFEDYLIKKQ